MNIDDLTTRVTALEREVMNLNPGIRLPDDIPSVATRNPGSHYLSKLQAIETAVREFLATEDLGLIKVREIALQKLRDALK